MSRAPVTLSREMKIGLIALLMLGLLGGWFVVNSNRAAQDMATVNPPVTTPATPSTSGSTVSGNTDASGTNASGTTGTDGTASGTGTEVVSAAPFPVTDPNGSTPDPTALPPKPSGINPDTPLLGLNGHNPFRPLRLDEKALADAGRITPPTSAAAVSTPSVTITRPSSSPQQINDALASSGNSSGAIPVSRLPGTSSAGAGRTTGHSTTASSSSGAIPISQLPGTSANTTGKVKTTTSGLTTTFEAPVIPGVTPTTTAQVPGKTVKVPSSQPTASKGKGTHSASTANGNNASTTATTPKPVEPPVVAMNVPGVSVPGSTSQSGSAGTSAGSNGKTSEQSSTGLSGNSLPTPGNPALITEAQPTTGNESGGTGTGKLASYVQEEQLVFDAAVLGPVNTAVLRSNNGFVVATVGQTLADSKVTVKEITATTVTLALGNETTTLQLDKR